MKSEIFGLMLAVLITGAPGGVAAAETPAQAGQEGRRNLGDGPGWSNFVETDFPFFSSVLDARKLGDGWPADNLTPRGLILNLGHGCWACFDTELLRLSAIWVGRGVSPASMSQGSYHTAGIKAPEGQGRLPQILGTPWLVNGIYPGWQTGEAIALTDPREPAPDEKEVGRGPLAPSAGQFKAIRLIQGGGCCLEYEVAGIPIHESIEARMERGQPIVQRYVRLNQVSQPLWLILGRGPWRNVEPLKIVLGTSQVDGLPAAELVGAADGLQAVRVRRVATPIEIRVAIAQSGSLTTWKTQRSHAPPGPRWAQITTTRGVLSPPQDAYVMDNVPLPLQNPWRRNVRLADIAFLLNARAVAVTFDGDIWTISGLDGALNEVRWRRFASGLHEPLSIETRGDDIFVFDRNGIWRLRDTDRNGEADLHELTSNAFAQTAETREFANAMKIAPDGSFVIAKGGQQGSTTGKQNGMVLRIPVDGGSAETLGWGLRQPFLGMHPKNGLVTASDQQGHYVPTTALHIIRNNQFYGFMSLLLPKEKYPASIADALTWIPHAVNPSGAGHVWTTGARLGPLDDALIHLSYYRPELFLVLLNHRASRLQAAVVSLTRDLPFAPLNGAVNPDDGQLYVAGFQIWGTQAKQVSGLGRLRYTGAPSTLPCELVPMDKGILLRFDTKLDSNRATNSAKFSAERWNYRRTANYGSPHFKLDGSKGQEPLTPSSAYLSKDGRSVFIGIPDMKPAMQMRFGWALALASGMTFEQNAYFTPHELTTFDPVRDGFEPLTVDLTPRMAPEEKATPLTAEEGQRVAELMGCVACHSTDGSTVGKVGPTWKGLFRSERVLLDGSKTIADEHYLRESIREPTAKILSGFDGDVGMPSYEGVISETQIEALVLYLKGLQ